MGLKAGLGAVREMKISYSWWISNEILGYSTRNLATTPTGLPRRKF